MKSRSRVKKSNVQSKTKMGTDRPEMSHAEIHEAVQRTVHDVSSDTKLIRFYMKLMVVSFLGLTAGVLYLLLKPDAPAAAASARVDEESTKSSEQGLEEEKDTTVPTEDTTEITESSEDTTVIVEDTEDTTKSGEQEPPTDAADLRLSLRERIKNSFCRVFVIVVMSVTTILAFVSLSARVKVSLVVLTVIVLIVVGETTKQEGTEGTPVLSYSVVAAGAVFISVLSSTKLPEMPGSAWVAGSIEFLHETPLIGEYLRLDGIGHMLQRYSAQIFIVWALGILWVVGFALCSQASFLDVTGGVLAYGILALLALLSLLTVIVKAHMTAKEELAWIMVRARRLMGRPVAEVETELEEGASGVIEKGLRDSAQEAEYMAREDKGFLAKLEASLTEKLRIVRWETKAAEQKAVDMVRQSSMRGLEELEVLEKDILEAGRKAERKAVAEAERLNVEKKMSNEAQVLDTFLKSHLAKQKMNFQRGHMG